MGATRWRRGSPRLTSEIGTPVLVAERLTLGQEGRPLEPTARVHRGDRHRLRASDTGRR
ncbi:UTRA domain-containing protein [Streptosporangium sp. NBC_01495]|uniref:UTRA domain-containing protein n=1 Tax=Streptosporangium sp. NBC_01495 TaxID=2903899 RepID=UPI003FCCA432